jgi:hypothetical protein
MKAVARRVSWLEDRLAPRTRNQIIVVLQRAGSRLVLTDACVEILRESGCIDAANRICLVDLLDIPTRLTASELEQYLREHGTKPIA